MERRHIISGCIVLIAVFVAVGIGLLTKKGKTEEAEATVELTQEQKEAKKKIKETYNVSNQEKIWQELEEKKASQEYTLDHMLVEQNPFGTNTQSLYVYFNTDEKASVTYTVSVEDSSIDDFSRSVYQKEEYQTEHEFQVIGLIPEMENQITFFITKEDGSTETRQISVETEGILGTEAVKLEQTVEGEVEELEEGLYVVLGNDSEALDFMYYYDNDGVLRGEVPLLGYRSHRLIFDEDSMYYSISETKMARVNRLGQVLKVYDLGDYELHHDYVFDDDGNMLILATDTTQDSVEDIILKLDVNSGEVTEVLDLEDLFGSYKAEAQKNSDDELDWMHINTLQWLGDGSILISSRETSSIIKIDNLYDEPVLSYIIGEKDFWADTEYENVVFSKEGDFTIQGGQHSVTYVEDDSLEEGQYYLYLFNNNIGISQSRPDYDWASIGLTESSAKEGEASYYYKYLVDENEGTFSLVDSFDVPYSGYVSSVQEIGNNTVVDSGMQGIFGEYDENHDLISSFEMEVEIFIYRVYKYDFEGFYFGQTE